jgi:peptidoglycan/LPS O-acetylase OafA/YrhL
MRASAGPAPSTSRLAGVEGLRALAATSIVVYHCWRYSAPGGTAVDLGPLSRFVLPHLPVGVTLFFTLSGFLLYRPLAASALRQTRRPSVRRYLRNRALRILPAYWAILLATSVLLPAALVRRSPATLELGRLIDQPVVLLSNAVLLQNYVPGALETGIGPAWSLAVEMIFYLVLPLLGWLAGVCARRASTPSGRTWAVLVPVGVIFLIGVADKAIFSWLATPTGYWPAMLARSFAYHADLFAFGMALAALRINLEDGRVRLPVWWRKAAGVTLALVVVLTVLLSDRGLLPAWGVVNPYQRLTALSCAVLLALVVLPDPEPTTRPPLTRLLETRLLVAVGLASYSLFLWHEPIVRLLQREQLTVGGVGGFWFNLVLLGLTVGGLSALTYRWVERPALSRKARDPDERRMRGRLAAGMLRTATKHRRTAEKA